MSNILEDRLGDFTGKQIGADYKEKNVFHSTNLFKKELNDKKIMVLRLLTKKLCKNSYIQKNDEDSDHLRHF